MDCDIIQVYYYWQSTVPTLPLQNALYYVLEVGWGLCEAHRHPDPPKLSLRHYKGGAVGGLVFKWDIVKPGFEVDHAYVLAPE